MILTLFEKVRGPLEITVGFANIHLFLWII